MKRSGRGFGAALPQTAPSIQRAYEMLIERYSEDLSRQAFGDRCGETLRDLRRVARSGRSKIARLGNGMDNATPAALHVERTPRGRDHQNARCLLPADRRRPLGRDRPRRHRGRRCRSSHQAGPRRQGVHAEWTGITQRSERDECCGVWMLRRAASHPARAPQTPYESRSLRACHSDCHALSLFRFMRGGSANIRPTQSQPSG